ncbi:MAG: hypothetical protein IPM14_09385 [bacterium]|nr:hypothetical protein [bacterium]
MKNSFVVITAPILILISASFILFFSISSDGNSKQLEIHPAEYYPRWLKNNEYKTSQTSGITLISERDDEKEFLLADDVGKIHRFRIKQDTLFSFSEIKFSDQANEMLANYPKWDFEEIFYDRYTGEVYLTIEGNGNEHLKYHNICKLKFLNNDILRDTIVTLEIVQFTPENVFNNKLQPNVGYEGLTSDENYFYLGLENDQMSPGEFSDHTLIKIADKNSLTIVKEISTDTLNISTVCGLYSDENYSLLGIDRNHRKVFKLLLDEYFNIIDLDFFEMKTVIPSYDSLEYVGSLESITITSEKFLFLVDDPWHTFFIPPNEILKDLDEMTVNNFKNFIPIIHKFEIEQK